MSGSQKLPRSFGWNREREVRLNIPSMALTTCVAPLLVSDHLIPGIDSGFPTVRAPWFIPVENQR